MRMNLPEEFIKHTKALLGEDEYNELEKALQTEPSASIRLNEDKLSAAGYARTEAGMPAEEVPWCATGRYLADRPTFTFDPLFHAGCYYVQEASSMFLEQILRQYIHAPVLALDLCAAPGGKSTHLRSLLPEGSLLMANEVIRSRSQILAENLIKWGHPAMVVTNNDPADFRPLTGLFDVVLADVPCSGEGMFRKDETAIKEWSVENVELCRQRQQRIISAIWDCLKPGGLLIYSTCTYNIWENEKNIRHIMDEYGAEPLAVDIPGAWGITGNLLEGETFPVYRFFPGRTKGEGLFMAALRKPAESGYAGTRTKSPDKGRRKQAKTAAVPSIVPTWLRNPENFILETNGSTVIAFPQPHAGLLDTIRKNLRVLHAGVTIGEIKGKDLIPSHALAMSSAFQSRSFPQQEVTYEQAISYLRKGTVTLSEGTPRGYVLLTYKNVPLGFVKNIGNRANNLYPGEWRIRSGFMPEAVKTPL